MHASLYILLSADLSRNPIFLLFALGGCLVLFLLLYGFMGKMTEWAEHMREMEFYPKRVKILTVVAVILTVVVLLLARRWDLPGDDYVVRRGVLGLVEIPCLILYFAWARKK